VRHTRSLDHEDDDTCEAMHRLLDTEGIEVLVAAQANDMGHAIRRTPDAERIEVWDDSSWAVPKVIPKHPMSPDRFISTRQGAFEPLRKPVAPDPGA
jgi:hypothetical protein